MIYLSRQVALRKSSVTKGVTKKPLENDEKAIIEERTIAEEEGAD